MEVELPVLEPLALRVAVGLVSLALLVRGRQIWKLAIAAPGILLGVAIGVALAQWLPLPGLGALVAAGVLGLAGAIAAWMVERAAVVLAGATAGAVFGLVLVPFTGAWWAPLVGLFAGGVLAPWVYRAMVPLFSAAIGAAGVAWAAAWPRTALVLGALAAFGLAVQLMSGRDEQDDADDG